MISVLIVCVCVCVCVRERESERACMLGIWKTTYFQNQLAGGLSEWLLGVKYT